MSVLWLALAVAQADVRQAVERSLPFLEKGGVAWMKDRKCASCHHVTFMVWSHREALDRGFAVDVANLDEWTRWTLDFALTSQSKDGTLNGGGLDTMTQILLTRPPKADVAPYRALAEVMRGLRKPDGLWEAGGQLAVQRRPKPETHEVSTLWALRALDSLGYDEPRLKDRAPGESTESVAVHLLSTPSDALKAELLARRNEDGGWGYSRGAPSDGLATGIALYALSYGKGDVDAIRRAQAFLVRTQRDDGSWNVPTTKASTKEPSIAIYWGTAWATIGLLRTINQSD